MKSFRTHFRLIVILTLFGCNPEVVSFDEAVRFIQTEFSLIKNEYIILNYGTLLSETDERIVLAIVELPENGTLNQFNGGVQYRPERDFTGTDYATVSLSLSSNPSKIVLTKVLTFKVEAIDNSNEGPFFGNAPCNFIPITDSKANRYFFLSHGESVSFNAFKDVVCEEAITDVSDYFEIVIVGTTFPQYGIIELKEDKMFTYKNTPTTGSKLDRVIYDVKYVIDGTKHSSRIIAFFLIEDPCLLGYTPNIDFYTIEVSRAKSITLSFFDNDFLCGLPKEEVKKNLTAFSSGTLEFALEPDWLPVGSFDLNNLTYTTNVTKDYFDQHPDAYARGYVQLEYELESGATIKSLIIISIVE